VPLLARAPSQVHGHRRGAGEVGVGRPEGQHDRRHGGGRAPGRTDGVPQQVSERHVGPGAVAKHGDRSDCQAQVQRRGGGEGDGDDAWQLPGGVAQPGGQRGGRLPADEGKHQDRGSVADGRPAVRRERGPVGGAGRRGGSGDGEDDHGEQERDERHLHGRRRADPAHRQPEHHEQQASRCGAAQQAAAAGQVGEIAGAYQAHDRCAADHPGEEAPAGRGAGPGAEAGGGVGDDPAR